MRIQRIETAVLAVLLAGVTLMCGCLDEDYEYSDDYSSSQEYEYPEESDSYDEYVDTELYSDSSSASSGDFTIYNYPKGTVKEASGTIAVVTIIADDGTSAWDFESGNGAQMLSSYHEELGNAMSWLEKHIKEYGKDINYIWDWEEHEELLYEASFKTDLGNTINSHGEGVFEADEIIANTIDSEAIMKSLNADGITYIFAVKTDPNSTCMPCTFCVGTGIEESQKDYYYYMEGREEPPYEYIILLMRENTLWYVTIAHEWIHTLGAPDLYAPGQRGITQELVDYLAQSGTNDIMADDGNENATITDITAYYMGLIDQSETVDQWGLAESDLE